MVPSAYEQPKQFINHCMRMSHVYQPVMQKTLLEKGGSASTAGIAQAILGHDQSPMGCYKEMSWFLVKSGRCH